MNKTMQEIYNELLTENHFARRDMNNHMDSLAMEADSRIETFDMESMVETMQRIMQGVDCNDENDYAGYKALETFAELCRAEERERLTQEIMDRLQGLNLAY